MPIDKFDTSTPTSTDLARRLKVVTPSDTVDLAEIPKAVRVGTDGDVRLIAVDDTEAVTLKCYATEVLPVRPRRILATGTTASDLVALY